MLKDMPGMQPGKPRLRNPVAQVTQPCLLTGLPTLPARDKVSVAATAHRHVGKSHAEHGPSSAQQMEDPSPSDAGTMADCEGIMESLLLF